MGSRFFHAKLSPKLAISSPFAVDTRPVPSLEADAPVESLRKIDSLLLLGLALLLAFGPLAYGAVEDWSIFVLRAAATSFFATWLVRAWLANSVELPDSNALIALLGFVILISIQLLTGSTSYRHATLVELLNDSAYGVFLIVACGIARDRNNLKRLLTFLVFFGFLLALFSLVQDFSGTEKLYWLRKPRAVVGKIYGPYVNGNHYAGLMEMIVPLALAWAVLENGGKRLLYSFTSVLMAATIFFARSRGGMAALTAELIVFVVLLTKFRGSPFSRRNWAGFLLFAAAVAGTVVYFGSDQVLHRLSDLRDTYRLDIYRDSLRMWLTHPVFGFGLGTFSWVFPAYQSFWISGLVAHAHNDYIELLVETGLIGSGLIVWFLISVLRIGLKKISRGSKEGATISVGVLAAIAGLLVHGLFDFNLHIPANATLFFVLCGILLSSSSSSRSRSSRKEPHEFSSADFRRGSVRS